MVHSLPPPKAVEVGPLIFLLMVASIASLGFYQMVYLPYLAVKAPQIPETVLRPPKNVTVIVLEGSFNPAQKENFSPREIVVVLGVNNTVIWINNDESTVSHTATSDTGLWDTGLFAGGERRNHTFTATGEFPYHCTPHPWMRGKILVLPGNFTLSK